MRNLLTPSHRVDDVRALSLDWLARARLRGLLLDLDGTLLPDRATACAPPIRAWLSGLAQGGIRLCVVSNSGPRRVEAGVGALHPALAYVSRAAKPRTAALRAAADRMALPPSAVALVGDQLFTDVLGGNRAGLCTILVRPRHADRRGEGWLTRAKRPLESLVLGELPWR